MKMWVAVFIFLISICSGCYKKMEPSANEKGLCGEIYFTVNGEDFVRNGFTGKDGWNLLFDHLYVNIVNPSAYSSRDSLLSVLEGDFFVDLAETRAGIQEIGFNKNVPPGNYQSLKFHIKRLKKGKYRGYSIVMIGSASKEGRIIPFEIKLDEEMCFDGKEGYVGEELKGLLLPRGKTRVEMTFHFDHVFGDMESSPEDHVNRDSVGFGFFCKYINNGKLAVSQKEISKDQNYPMLIKSIWSTGHLGEGHCEVSEQSSCGKF